MDNDRGAKAIRQIKHWLNNQQRVLREQGQLATALYLNTCGRVDVSYSRSVILAWLGTESRRVATNGRLATVMHEARPWRQTQRRSDEATKESGCSERDVNEQVQFVIVYGNRFEGLNLGAIIGVKIKIEPTKIESSTQIKCRGPDLDAPIRVALIVCRPGIGPSWLRGPSAPRTVDCVAATSLPMAMNPPYCS
jgi:hypothetical protein